MFVTCLIVPLSKCFFIAFLIRNFFLSSSISGYFFRIYFMTDWYETLDLSLQDCKENGQDVIFNKVKRPSNWLCWEMLMSYEGCTHCDSFNEDVINFVLSACEVGNWSFFTGSDASPRRNRPLHLLDLGFLVLVAVLQPVTKRNKNTRSVKRLDGFVAIFHCDGYHPYLYHILTLVGEHSSVLHTVQPRSPCISHFVHLSPTGKTKLSFRTSVLMTTIVIWH